MNGQINQDNIKGILQTGKDSVFLAIEKMAMRVENIYIGIRGNISKPILAGHTSKRDKVLGMRANLLRGLLEVSKKVWFLGTSIFNLKTARNVLNSFSHAVQRMLIDIAQEFATGIKINSVLIVQ